MEPVKNEKEICTLLEQKLAHFKQYLCMTKKIREFLGNKEDNNNLGGLISRRQNCIHKIEKLDLSVGKLIKKSPDGLARISSKYMGVMDVYLSKIKDIMAAVDFMDKELVAIVTAEGESVKRELLQMRNARQAARGYRMNTRYNAKFLDMKR